MELRTKRLTLRPLLESDWPSMQGLWLDFSESPYAQYDTPHKVEAAEVRALCAEFEASGLFHAVCLDGDVIGFVCFHDIDGAYDLGYCFYSSAQGKGYASEAIRALLNYHRERGVKKFTAGTALANTPSVKLLTALGFRQAGTEQVSFYKDDEGREIYFPGGIFELGAE